MRIELLYVVWGVNDHRIWANRESTIENKRATPGDNARVRESKTAADAFVFTFPRSAFVAACCFRECIEGCAEISDTTTTRSARSTQPNPQPRPPAQSVRLSEASHGPQQPVQAVAVVVAIVVAVLRLRRDALIESSNKWWWWWLRRGRVAVVKTCRIL